VMPRSCIDTLRRALVAPSPADLVGFGLQQRVERLLDTRAHHLLQLPAYLLLIDPNRVLQSFRCILCHGGLAVVWIMVVSQLPLNQIGATALKCAKDTLRHRRLPNGLERHGPRFRPDVLGW